MRLDRFSSILAVTAGCGGAVLVAKGILRLSPDLIAKLSQTHFGFSLAELQNLASQKADVVSGTLLVLVAFLLQFSSLVFVRTPRRAFGSHWIGASIAFGLGLLIIAASLGVNKILYARYERDAKRILAKLYLEQTVKQDPIIKAYLEAAEQQAEMLLDIRRGENESGSEFLRRVAIELQVPIPPNLRVEGEQ